MICNTGNLKENEGKDRKNSQGKIGTFCTKCKGNSQLYKLKIKGKE